MILGHLNRQIISRTPDAMTTAAVVAYYSQEREARISYAGHPPVLYKRASQTSWEYVRPNKLKGNAYGLPLNLPLATDQDTLYSEIRLPIFHGDRIFVYTDGIIDTPDGEGKPFGLKRLKHVLDENAKTPLHTLQTNLLRRLDQYAGCKRYHDDVTMMILEVTRKPGAGKVFH